MTDEEIYNLWNESDDCIFGFARAIETKVHEEDARICEEIAFTVKTVGTDEHGLVADACAKAIRARGKE